MEIEEFEFQRDSEEEQVRINALRVGTNDNRFAVLIEEDLDNVENWDLDDTRSIESEEGEFPLLIEISDEERTDNEEVVEIVNDEETIDDSESEFSTEEFLYTTESEETDSEEYQEEDEIVFESKVLIAALRMGEEIPNPKERKSTNEKSLTKVRKSSKPLERPIRTKTEVKTFVAMVKINGQAAVALLDSGCTTDAVSPELVRVADLKVHELTEQVPVQLGTKGSQSKINYGTKTCIKYGSVDAHHYFDIVNIDRYNVILGTVFLRKHGIVLDFDKDEIKCRGETFPALKENTDAYLLVRRQAMRFKEEPQEKSKTSTDEGTSIDAQK
jgi:hypothetical protein